MKREVEEVYFEAPVHFLLLPTRIIGTFISTTPNVGGTEVWKANNNGTITNFTGGAAGQSLKILGDGSTVIQNNVNIVTNTGADKTLLANKVYRFTLFDKWYEDA